MNQEQFYQWQLEIQQHFPDLKKWQTIGLAMIIYGIMKAKRSQASLIAEELVEFGKASTVERRIQRWISNQRIAKKGLDTAWVKWIMEVYQGQNIYLLVDETKLSDRIGCMMISLAFRQRAIPLVWKCYRANSKADYPEDGQVGVIVKLLKIILPVMPKDRQIVVQADRGIGNSSNLMNKIAEMGLFFLFRVKQSSVFIADNGEQDTLGTLTQPGGTWYAEGILFTKRKIKSCVHVIWDKGQDEPWCLATNLVDLAGRDYAMRVWQEESFRDLKSGGWQWQNCLSRNPDTIDRLLLPMAIAYAWCISLGLLFYQLDETVQRQIDYVRKHVKYSIFRKGIRYFKRMFALDDELHYFQIGPFYDFS